MFELIHTSAPRGLFGGSGYTTVAATQGMPEALRKVLESLSGYEQVFDYGSQQFQANPEAYICQPVGQAAGKSWWVLSRIVVAEKDYTGRSNYLAHHVALDHNELPQAGPASLARAFPWMSSWSGEPRMLTPRPLPKIDAPAPPLSAPAWCHAGLDAGWAGHLAEQARSRRGVIQLIYPQTVNPLALIADAVALLPPAERWDARFHTHTSRPRPDLAWAWFPAEANTTTDLARRPGVVYLATRPPCPSMGPLVDQARGKVAPVPAMGGAGTAVFPGSNGSASLPVATAFATDPYAPTGRGNAGSWGAPPVPAKASLVGPILHWTAHGLMVGTALVLAGMWALEMRTVHKKELEIARISAEKHKADEVIGKKDAEIANLMNFKTNLKKATKCSAEEFEAFGDKDTLIPGNLVMELAKRLKAKDGPGDHAPAISKEDILNKSFDAKGPHYTVAGETIANLRIAISEMEKSKDAIISEKSNAVKKLEMQVAESKSVADQFRAIKDFGKLPEAPWTKAGPIELRFQLTDQDVRFLAAAQKVYERDEAALKSIRMLVLGLRPADAFPVSVLQQFATDIKKMNNPKSPWWKQIFEKAHTLTDHRGTGDKITSATVLYAYAVTRDMTEDKEPPFDDPNINAHYSKTIELAAKFPEAFVYIKRKLGELQP